MTERVYPSNKGNVQNLNGTYTKGQMYGASLPAYRPEPPKRRNRCRTCCICFAAVIGFLILILGIAVLVLWIVYRPHAPSFSVGAVQITRFNITKNKHVDSEVALQLKARNPNKKITFFYGRSTLKISSNDVDLAEGSFPGFFHGKKNTTIVKADLKTRDLVVGASDAKAFKSAQSKGKLPVDIQLDTHMKVKIGGLKSRKIKIRVICNEVSATIPENKKALVSAASDTKCKLKFKLFKYFKL